MGISIQGQVGRVRREEGTVGWVGGCRVGSLPSNPPPPPTPTHPLLIPPPPHKLNQHTSLMDCHEA